MVEILSTESLNLTISDVGSFRFTEPIVFDVEMAGNGIVLGNAEADLFASGKTLDEALADLQSEIEGVEGIRHRGRFGNGRNRPRVQEMVARQRGKA